MSGKGVLSVDGLDALVRGLAVTTVIVLSLLGYERPESPAGAGYGKVLEPLVVAVALVLYNVLVIALLGVPWRHRPGFYLFLFDWVVASLAIALTGWLFSPFIVLLYALAIGSALRLGLSRPMFVVCGCALLFLSAGAFVPSPMEGIKLPILVVEMTSLVMVAMTAAAMRRAVEVEIRRVELEEQSAGQFRLLNDLINSLLQGTPEMDRVARSVALVSRTALNAEAGLVVISEDGDSAECGRSDPSAASSFYLAADRDPNPVALSGVERELVRRALALGEPLIMTSAWEGGSSSFPSLGRHGSALQTILCVPFSSEANCTGAIMIARPSHLPFSLSEVNLLAAIAQQLAVAVRLVGVYALEREKALVSAERERLERDLLSIVSHDLRTPLTAIKMCVGALSKGSDDDTQQRLVRNIERNADRLTALVDDLIDMARLRSGRVRLDLQALNLGEVIGELASQVWPMVEGKNQSLRVDLPAAGSLRWNSLNVMADRKRVEQVLLNLISNAHKFAPDDSSITVGATPRGGAVRVFVRDEGPGVAPHERQKIFEKFYSHSHSAPGTPSASIGLGLAIARSLVRMHGGEIGVKSRVGGGSTFFFTMPREQSTVSLRGPIELPLQELE